ncbi:MAG: chorismate synthase, partial [Bacteroidota bacterium]
KSKDYEAIKDIYRPSHADFTYEKKYGIRDYRGGGRSSARETLARVVAGAVAKLFLNKYETKIFAYVSRVHQLKLNKKYYELDLTMTENSSIRCPDKETSELFIEAIEKAKKEGNSLGGVITCVIKNMPIGLGEPVFDKLNADLGKAMLSINAVKGFELGEGFDSINYKGSELNDEFYSENGKIKTKSNHSGGIQGGISNGEDIYFNVAFKPTATILSEQNTVKYSGEEVKISVQGRHDPCVLPRAVPIVEAMSAIVIADHLLRSRTNKL